MACHSPGTGGPGILNCGGDDPSLARRAIMADAAASPVAMPSILGLTVRYQCQRVGALGIEVTR